MPGLLLNAMAARSIWNGNLKVGSKVFPVRLFSAVQDKTIRFNLLDARTMHRVKQHMVNPNTGREVSRDEIRKGFETESNRVVFLRQTRDIEVAESLPLGAIPHHWYERPYDLGPDGEDLRSTSPSRRR